MTTTSPPAGRRPTANSTFTVAPEVEQLATPVAGRTSGRGPMTDKKRFFDLSKVDFDDEAAIRAWADAVWATLADNRKEDHE